MATEKEDLLELRNKIDKIDDCIQDLLNERAKVVDAVSIKKAKQLSNIKIRPGREAAILYRLIEQHQGRFPKRELARIWRELIVATIKFEGPFSMAIYYNESETGFWDLARDQYGSNTPATCFSSVRRVIEAVQNGDSTLGIVPVPAHDENENWWQLIVSDLPETPKIIARLPFIGYGNIRNKGLEACVICNVEHEEMERARSFIAVESNEEIGFNVVNKCLVEVDLSFTFHQVWHNPERPPEWTYLIELSQFLNKNGHKAKQLSLALEKHALRLLHLGGYALPLIEEDFKVSSKKN
uniref:Chorismate mutase domain-containing protein n=1 Tax=uncultured nuHF1 cluster bacterium HF0770_35I22 TaxID=723586 RepID=E7C7P7_9BACT|nr:hypothetical protein [uncultured nuHF1 cluster bacterium HF0770_35I22]